MKKKGNKIWTDLIGLWRSAGTVEGVVNHCGPVGTLVCLPSTLPHRGVMEGGGNSGGSLDTLWLGGNSGPPAIYRWLWSNGGQREQSKVSVAEYHSTGTRVSLPSGQTPWTPSRKRQSLTGSFRWQMNQPNSLKTAHKRSPYPIQHDLACPRPLKLNQQSTLDMVRNNKFSGPAHICHISTAFCVKVSH